MFAYISVSMRIGGLSDNLLFLKKHYSFDRDFTQVASKTVNKQKSIKICGLYGWIELGTEYLLQWAELLTEAWGCV